jgi:hypothetical protein
MACRVEIWRDRCRARASGRGVLGWFANVLQIETSLYRLRCSVNSQALRLSTPESILLSHETGPMLYDIGSAAIQENPV